MRLDRATIYHIIEARHNGMTRRAVAARFTVDQSTVRYHEEQFVDKYGSLAAIVSMIAAAPKPCIHPSLKCLVCGRAQDHIHRAELHEIRQLRRALGAANAKLIQLGRTPIEPGTV